MFGGHDITAICRRTGARRLGIARTFQIVQPFAGLTVAENIAVGAFLREPDGEPHARRRDDRRPCRPAGRTRQASRGSLTVAGRKRLELARALATRPKLLLLDEVLAGLNPSEIRDMIPVVRAIRDQGVTILMIEHVMQAVMSLCDPIYVLAQGRMIARGSPDEIAANPAVIEAYLGEAPPSASRGARMADASLAVEGVVAGYGVPVLRGVSSVMSAWAKWSPARCQWCRQDDVEQGAVWPCPCRSRACHFDGDDITRLSPREIVKRGLIHVPEGRKIFPNMHVEDNLVLGSYARAKAAARGQSWSAST